MSLEIERKFIMEGFPEDLKCLREVTIEQGYVSVMPEVRIHTATDQHTGVTNYRLTMKGEGNLTRTEIKTSIDGDFYREAVELLGVPMIQKDYRSYELPETMDDKSYGRQVIGSNSKTSSHALILEVCLVDPGTEHEFYYGEIEFETEEDAMHFTRIPCLGKEVTNDPAYKMKNYWIKTRLQK